MWHQELLERWQDPCAGCRCPLEPDDTQRLLRMAPSCPGRAPAIQFCCLHDTALIFCPCLGAGKSHRAPAGTEQPLLHAHTWRRSQVWPWLLDPDQQPLARLPRGQTVGRGM